MLPEKKGMSGTQAGETASRGALRRTELSDAMFGSVQRR
ncbi:hypothetical protein CES85_5700 [Ochrobactrum quorumnocens]|uniref:Uncharacterized protein n=1 Tax=Ochrobactrum quorumnocens TaxID=271865 RepID=A0A248UE03_9HYPH|nr:hypothetical protein CES85_5700 [[Ochrobactrum] quorumnocens]